MAILITNFVYFAFLSLSSSLLSSAVKSFSLYDFLYLLLHILYDSFDWESVLRTSSPAEENTQTPQIYLRLLNGIRNPDRNVGEVADRAGCVKGATDIHRIRLGIRRCGFCSPRAGDRASLLSVIS